MEWTPTISDRRGALYQRIADALAADIAAGRLTRGQQLPTHRALAEVLGIDLSTVTRAYSEARARGLVEARVGHGTFVAETVAQAQASASAWATYDLSMNLPPQPLVADLEGRITRGIAAIGREGGLAGLLSYREAGGIPAERDAAAQWLRTRIGPADPSRLLICPGTQTVLWLLLGALTAPGDVVLTESLTYPGMKAAAEKAGVRLVGVATDEAGILPDHLNRAIRRYKPKALYLVPTLNNPTTVTMPLVRRKAVAKILRNCGLKLIEDDAYGLLEPEVVPMAALLPEMTYYAGSLSKCIAPGFRVSLLLTPDESEADRFSNSLRTMVQMTPPLMAGLVARWLRDGSADAIIAAIREEAAARQKLAAQILGKRVFAARPHGHHLWLPLDSHWTPKDFVAHVHRQGLAIVGSDAFAVGGEAPNAVRVALGAASSRHELGTAIGLLATALDAPSRVAHVV